MRVLSVRVPDDEGERVEKQRLDMGLSRTEWMRWAVRLGLDNAPPAPAPDPVASQFCSHPEAKRVGGFCVGCSTEVGPERLPGETVSSGI